jgi:PAS domain S-box-containing protein
VAPGLFAPFYGAVIISAWYAGLSAGLLATAASVVVTSVLMPWRTAAGALEPLTVLRAVLFVLTASPLSVLISAMESARRRVVEAERRSRSLAEDLETLVVERTAALSRANQTLTDEMAARERTTEALRESEQRFASAFDAAPIGMVLFHLQETPVAVEANRAFREMLGYDAAEVADGMPYVCPEDLDAARTDIQRMLSGTVDSYQAQRRLVHRAGHVVWAQVNVSVVRTSAGTPRCLLAQLQDITAPKQAEEILRASEASYRNLLQNISDAILLVDDQGLLTYISPAIEVVSGYRSSEIAGRLFPEFVHPDDIHLAWRTFESAMRNVVEPNEYRVVTRAGEIRWVHVTGVPAPQPDGRVGMRALLVDITEAKRVEAALAARERRFGALIESVSDMVVLLDSSGKFRYVGPSVSRILGYPTDDLIGLDGFDLVFPEDKGRIRALYAELVATPGKTTTTQYRFRHHDGSVRWLESIATNRLDDPQVQAVVLNARDITERKEFEQHLRESELKFRTLAETAAAAIFIYQQGHLRYVNQAGIALTGYTHDELLTMDFWTLIDTRFRDAARARGEARQRGAALPPRAMVRLTRKDGGKRWVDFTAALIEYDQAPAILGTAFDITDQKQAEKEARLRQAELAHVLRLSTINEMASSLAHELNQPLQAVVNFSRGCLHRLQKRGDSADLREALEQIAHEALRAGEIVRRIRQFVRKGQLKREWVNLNDLLAEAARMVETEAMRDGITMEFAVSPNLPAVQVDAVQIEQVILNLMRNAVEAMPATREGERRIRIETAVPHPGAVDLSVHDTGDGFDTEMAERVFTPFFTTKASGLGMGLSISRSIITAHGGQMWVRSRPGHGATFGFTIGTSDAGEARDT